MRTGMSIHIIENEVDYIFDKKRINFKCRLKQYKCTTNVFNL